LRLVGLAPFDHLVPGAPFRPPALWEREIGRMMQLFFNFGEMLASMHGLIVMCLTVVTVGRGRPSRVLRMHVRVEKQQRLVSYSTSSQVGQCNLGFELLRWVQIPETCSGRVGHFNARSNGLTAS
jgi:hypothetical protein